MNYIHYAYNTYFEMKPDKEKKNLTIQSYVKLQRKDDEHTTKQTSPVQSTLSRQTGRDRVRQPHATPRALCASSHQISDVIHISYNAEARYDAKLSIQLDHIRF